MFKMKFVSFTVNTEVSCPTCDGTGWVHEDGERHFCPTCGGTGKTTY